MDVFLRIDINIMAMILLGTVVFIAYGRLDRRDTLNQIFLTTSMIIMLQLLFETLTCVINKRPETWLIPVSEILHACLFVTGPILTCFWYFFISRWIVPYNSISYKSRMLLLIPAALNTVMAALSPVSGWFFYIDGSNTYHRGSLFLVSAFITYLYLLISLFVILRQKKKIIKQEFLPLFIFGILPVAGGLFQSLFYGVLLMWSTTAFSLVIVYNFLQQRMVHLDSLTGAWTRGSFDYYILQRVKHKSSDGFGVIFFDIDGLKHINDTYGHFEGDNAIKTAIQLIKGSLRKTDVVARFGGDEFVIVMDCDGREDLVKMIERINNCFDRYNSGSGKEYKLECSFGADIYDSGYENIDQFLRHVDSLMYNNKKLKK